MATKVDPQAVANFKSSLRGQLLGPEDGGYDEARKLWNGAIDRRPALIARCVNAADVVQAVNFARTHGLLLAVRGGGHSFPGHSVCDGGLMIDLSQMQAIRIDPERRRARAEPGVTWGTLDRETQTHDLAVTGGQISTTGIAGLTLGGGLGWLMRKHGLTCDNLVSAELVTADGRQVTASAEQNPDLFWGLRGGGGNFGIVTSFEYQLHRVGTVIGGLVGYPLSEAKTVLRSLRAYLATAPEELTTTIALLTFPDGNPAVGVAACYAGDPSTGEKVFQPLRGLGTPVMDQVEPMPYATMQGLLDLSFPPGCRYYMKSNFLNALSDEVIDVLLDHFPRVPSPLSSLSITQMGGAVSRMERQATAFYHRDASFSFSLFSNWTELTDDEQNIAWARRLFEALRPFAPSAVYVNELVDEGDDRIKAAYGPSYDRLVALKNKYDPSNLFRLNQNIKPTV